MPGEQAGGGARERAARGGPSARDASDARRTLARFRRILRVDAYNGCAQSRAGPVAQVAGAAAFAAVSAGACYAAESRAAVSDARATRLALGFAGLAGAVGVGSGAFGFHGASSALAGGGASRSLAAPPTHAPTSRRLTSGRWCRPPAHAIGARPHGSREVAEDLGDRRAVFPGDVRRYCRGRSPARKHSAEAHGTRRAHRRRAYVLVVNSGARASSFQCVRSPKSLRCARSSPFASCARPKCLGEERLYTSPADRCAAAC